MRAGTRGARRYKADCAATITGGLGNSRGLSPDFRMSRWTSTWTKRPKQVRYSLGLGMGRTSSKDQRPIPLGGHSHYSLGGVFLVLGHDFGTENRASRTLFTTPAKPCHRLFTFFLLAISTA